MLAKPCILASCWLFFLGSATVSLQGADFDALVQPLLVQKCVRCHGEKEVKGEVNFKNITAIDHLLAKPDLIRRMIEAIDAKEMPPEPELGLEAETRTRLVASLKEMLRDAKHDREARVAPMRRLNRLQYNNSVKDLFQLKGEVFPLPEKLITRHDDYLRKGKMPDKVRVESLALHPKPGLSDVQSFPKDLRASHGFDNQADQLTLSPLVLDSFLRLARSIVESPDFNEKNVGIWRDFFQPPPEGPGQAEEIQRRLKWFLRIAFRGPVSEETLYRYTAFAVEKMTRGQTFTEGMKNVATIALSSPMFLYRSSQAEGKEDSVALASTLSFFLWGSCPDEELLRRAESGELARPEVLQSTVERMLADPKIERFLDTFPSQWMRLENVLSATPDPQIDKFFSLDKQHPASLQMLVEPLLLFDAVFVEDRPIVQLIAPPFSYQSEFLKTWYTTDRKAPLAALAKVEEENRRHDARRKSLEGAVSAAKAELEALVESVRTKLLAEKKTAADGGPRVIAEAEWMAAMTPEQQGKREVLDKTVKQLTAELKSIPPPVNPAKVQEEEQRKLEEAMRQKLRSQTFERVAATDPRYGGVITNAAVMSMTSGPKRTHPIARGAWVIEVIFNSPPAPPPNNVPPLKEETGGAHTTIREQFAAHRENPTCAGCHSKLDPLGFALENFDITGRWRDQYENGRAVDSSGTLLKTYEFDGVVRFKEAIVKENRRFAKAFTAHLLRYALAGELRPADWLSVEQILDETEKDEFKLKSLIREMVRSESFLNQR